MVVLLKLEDDYRKLATDDSYWIKWTNAAQSRMRTLALTACSQTNKFVAGVSYDDLYQRFVYWEVNAETLGVYADSYYDGTTFVRAAAWYDWEKISGSATSDIYRFYLAGYATAYQYFDTPPNLYGIESPMLMDTLCDLNMCYNWYL